MSWECKTVEKLREEFVQAAANGEKISKLCREFGISRPTAYKWMKRAQAGESMSDQSRRPKQIANRVAAHVEEKVLEMRTANPGWGGKTIHAVLQREGYPDLPCAKTCDNILKRNGRIDPEESAKHKAYLRFQKEQCNQMWQTDWHGRKFCVSDFRQTQEYHSYNVNNRANTPCPPLSPSGWNGMRAGTA